MIPQPEAGLPRYRVEFRGPLTDDRRLIAKFIRARSDQAAIEAGNALLHAWGHAAHNFRVLATLDPD